MKNFYERLEGLLASKNISKNQFAKATGISTGNLGNWKRGESLPGAHALMTIADFFGVSIDWLLKGTESPQSQELDLEMQTLLEKYKTMTPENQKKVRFMLEVAMNTVQDSSV